MRRSKRPAGWRTVEIGALEVWWIVGKPRVIAQADRSSAEAGVQSIVITITAMQANQSGVKLIATVLGKRAIAVPSAGFADVQTFAVTPVVIRKLVETAAPAGMWPEEDKTWHCELELPQLPLPSDLSFRAEHLDGLTVVWTAQ